MAKTKKRSTHDAAGHSPSAGASPSDGLYEAVLLKAFDKLSSQILVFLLAYAVVLIVMARVGPALTTGLRGLLYVIPVLGIGGYMWFEQRKIVRGAAAHGIRVRGGIVTGGYLGGVRGAATPAAGGVDVGVGILSGKGVVVGQDVGTGAGAGPADAQYLVSLFEGLSAENRHSLIATAIALQQQASGRRS